LPTSGRIADSDQVSGTSRHGAFASDVAQFSRIVTLNNVAIVNEKAGLSMEAIAKTFIIWTTTSWQPNERPRGQK
jgi:Tfp pilus assembly protein PilO